TARPWRGCDRHLAPPGSGQGVLPESQRAVAVPGDAARRRQGDVSGSRGSAQGGAELRALLGRLEGSAAGTDVSRGALRGDAGPRCSLPGRHRVAHHRAPVAVETRFERGRMVGARVRSGDFFYAGAAGARLPRRDRLVPGVADVWMAADRPLKSYLTRPPAGSRMRSLNAFSSMGAKITSRWNQYAC